MNLALMNRANQATVRDLLDEAIDRATRDEAESDRSYETIMHRLIDDVQAVITRLDAAAAPPETFACTQPVDEVAPVAKRVCAGAFGVPEAAMEVTGRRRTQRATEAGTMAVYLTRALTGVSFQAVERAFGYRDHSTVFYACRKIAASKKARASARTLAAIVRVELGRGAQ